MFKRVLAIVLCLALLLCSCGGKNENSNDTIPIQESDIATAIEETNVEQISSAWLESYYDQEYAMEHFSSLGDEELLTYVEDVVYAETVASLDSEEYFVENVSAVYISQEYLDEITFNSQSNIFFGYTLEELDKAFQDTRYVFTLEEDGQTAVQELTELKDETFENVLKDVAIGTGVILLCVTVSALSGGLGAPAVAMIFSFSAKAGATAAISSAAFGGITAGVVRGIETGDMEEALTAAALAGGEGFKWGAISGAVIGGASQGSALYSATKQTNFTMNQYAQIQQETGYPLDVIKQFHTMDEYQAFRHANLKPAPVGNKTALIKTDIDLTRVDAKGRTNLERMKQGLAPQDSNGVSYELHHVGQKKDGTLAIMSQAEHDNPAIHGFLQKTEAHAEGTNWNAERQTFWKAFAELVE